MPISLNIQIVIGTQNLLIHKMHFIQFILIEFSQLAII